MSKGVLGRNRDPEQDVEFQIESGSRGRAREEGGVQCWECERRDGTLDSYLRQIGKIQQRK